ncbi:MAG: RNA 2',3'-cyclic phosphodiesterase [Pseudomonadota bacterium]
MIRAFLAIEPPEDLRDRLADLAEDLDDGRPVAWENIHLTLVFLGSVRPEALEDAAVELERLHEPAPWVEVEGLGVFGGGAPRVAFAQVRPDPALTSLHDALRRACRRGGLELPRRRFTPHFTLARFPARAPAGPDLHRWLSEHVAFRAEPFAPGAVRLMRSDLTPDGPNYTELMDIPLAPPAPRG